MAIVVKFCKFCFYLGAYGVVLAPTRCQSDVSRPAINHRIGLLVCFFKRRLYLWLGLRLVFIDRLLISFWESLVLLSCSSILLLMERTAGEKVDRSSWIKRGCFRVIFNRLVDVLVMALDHAKIIIQES